MRYTHFKKPKNTTHELQKLKARSSNDWKTLGEKKLIALTNFALTNVPAYGQFLLDNGVNLRKVSSLADYQKLPLVSKKDYLKKYDYPKLFPKDNIGVITTVSSTSGSTGEPFYFPRGEEQDAQYEYVAEMYLRNQFEIGDKRTLAICGFGLGIWIGGIFTYKNFNQIAAKGYSLAVAPVGTNKEIFLKTFARMAPLFDQVILMGYPPFLKDVIDDGTLEGIKWRKYNLKVMTATEGYSEDFRMYLVKKLGLKSRYTDILNIYGSVEFGTMSHETPIANLIRKIAVENELVFKEVFPGATTTPTLAQYYPNIVYFEQVNGEVVASGMGSSIPLIRYRFFDRGGVLGFDQMVAALKHAGVDILKEAKKQGIEHTIIKLPFVYVYGRSDFVVILHGANIYPEHIKGGVEDESLENYVTGKFTMLIKEDKNLNEYLEVNVELKKGIGVTRLLKEKVTSSILKALIKRNTEFNYLYNTEGKKLTPSVILYSYGDPKYFGEGIKHKWVRV